MPLSFHQSENDIYHQQQQAAIIILLHILLRNEVLYRKSLSSTVAQSQCLCADSATVPLYDYQFFRTAE